MKPYYETGLGKLYHGLCEKIMPELEQADFILTDPPYGLKFMGKKWDYDVPGVETFKLMLNAVKPGATMFCFAGSRTQHRMAVNIEDAGWILKDCIMWLYGSGFPKATNISKQIDKIAGVKPIDLGVSPNWRESKRDREKDGKMEVRGKNAGRLTEPTTDKAQLWNGWKSHGLKPAYEPILVCMKTNEGSYADNALKHGVAGLNIDGGKIGEEQLSYTSTFKRMINKNIEQGHRPITMQGSGGEINKIVKGRYPANIILDEEVAEMLDEQSGGLKSGKHSLKERDRKAKGMFAGGIATNENWYGDKGGASRFFYCAKASKSERNAGCEDLEEKEVLWSSGKKSPGTFQSPNTNRLKKNHHPTVKPLKLIEYLLTLLRTPIGGICFDPFGGSGTIGIACERLNLKWIIIEKELESVKIAKARIKNERKQLKMF